MKYRTLGRTELQVSEIGFGAWAIGGNDFGNSYGSTDDRNSVQAVLKAVDMGCNFFDTADVYGHGRSESILGYALKDVREKVCIATKVGGDFYHGPTKMNFSSEYITFALEESLKRLQTDYIDLYQLHNPILAMIHEGSIFEVMEGLKKQGKIRLYGVSIHDPQEGIEVLRLGKLDTIQVVYNIFYQEPAKELFPLATEKNIGIIVREPLANGFLVAKYRKESIFEEGDIRHYWRREMIEARVEAANALKNFLAHNGRTLAQASLKFVLAEPAVSVTIPGAKTATQVEENLGASELSDLTDHEMNELIRAFRR